MWIGVRHSQDSTTITNYRTPITSLRVAARLASGSTVRSALRTLALRQHRLTGAHPSPSTPLSSVEKRFRPGGFFLYSAEREIDCPRRAGADR